MSRQTNSLRPSKFFGPTLGTGLLLLLMSIGLVVLTSDNFFAIGLGWFTFLIGIMLVLMGTLQNQPGGKSLSRLAAAQLKKITG
ncbi:hypothetical protein E6H16_01625 [Candidatus Bathyarchaeota archaeon]|nr:MAG: hypothetical protein E6H16_01625 [Candidatus Bathyarchaeota archaeon]